MKYYRPTVMNEDVIHHYTCWDINHNFQWKVDSKHGPCWIGTDFIFIAWKPWKNHSGSVSMYEFYFIIMLGTKLQG